MAKGQPDFGKYAPTTTIAGMSDLGELAARLGSIVTFDRRGNVIALDNFENGVEQWLRYGSTGYSVDWDSSYFKTGGFSCKLTTGAVVGRNCVIQKHIGYPALSSLGFEISFSYKQHWDYIEFYVLLADGTYEYEIAIAYDHDLKKLQYYDAAAVYQDVPSGAWEVAGAPQKFDTLKFVADFDAAEYVRLLVNSQAFDLSTISLRKRAIASTPGLLFSILLKTSAAAAAIGYIDDVIFTQNEL